MSLSSLLWLDPIEEDLVCYTNFSILLITSCMLHLLLLLSYQRCYPSSMNFLISESWRAIFLHSFLSLFFSKSIKLRDHEARKTWASFYLFESSFPPLPLLLSHFSCLFLLSDYLSWLWWKMRQLKNRDNNKSLHHHLMIRRHHQKVDLRHDQIKRRSKNPEVNEGKGEKIQ